MRKGRREVLLVLVVFLAGTIVRAARYEKGKPAGSEELVGITVELSWTTPGGDARGAPGAKTVSEVTRTEDRAVRQSLSAGEKACLLPASRYHSYVPGYRMNHRPVRRAANRGARGAPPLG